MSTSKNINTNRWIRLSMIIAFALAILTFSQASLSAKDDKDKGQEEKQNEEKMEAQLLYHIEQWLDGNPVAFEEETKKVIEDSMHETAKKTKALEARLQAQIEYLERLEGFLPEESKQAAKKTPVTAPTSPLKQ